MRSTHWLVHEAGKTEVYSSSCSFTTTNSPHTPAPVEWTHQSSSLHGTGSGAVTVREELTEGHSQGRAWVEQWQPLLVLIQATPQKQPGDHMTAISLQLIPWYYIQRTAYPEEQFHNSAGVTEDGESLETQGTFHPDKTEGSALVDAEFPTTTYHLLMCPAWTQQMLLPNSVHVISLHWI